MRSAPDETRSANSSFFKQTEKTVIRNASCLKIGDPVPDFYLPPSDGVSQSFYEKFCGQPVLLLFTDSAAELHRFASFSGKVPLLCLSDGEVSAGTRQASGLIMRTPGSLRQRLTQSGTRSELVLLDDTLRLYARLPATAPEAALAEVIENLPSPVVAVNHRSCAPVLMVPKVLDDTLCQQLIRQHQRAHEASGMVRQKNGKQMLAVDEIFKVRSDHLLVDAQLAKAAADAITHALLPAIARSFHYQVASFEGFKVVAYSADNGGHFAPHRDNISKETRHRRFGLSINLNDNFAGGELLFPEFGQDRYTPPAGGAAVFSGSLLHQAQPVSAGVRYALLTFLW